MIATIIVIAVLVSAALLLSSKIRSLVFDGLAGATDYVIGAWPTWGQLRVALGPVLIAFLVFLGIAILIWIVFFFTMLAIGITHNSGWSGAIIGMLLPIWCLLLIIRPRKKTTTNAAGKTETETTRPRMLINFLYYPVAIFLLLATPYFLLGLLSPEIKESAGRRMENGKQVLANSLDKGSIQSEPEAGIFARVTRDVTLRNKNGLPIKVLSKGEVVRVLNLSGTKVNNETEGMTDVMYQDEYGDYSGTKIGQLPSRVLDWNWKREQAPAEVKEANYTPPAPTTTIIQVIAPPVAAAPTPQVTTTHGVVYWGDNYETKFDVVVRMEGDNISFQDGQRRFTGIKDGTGLYSGSWRLGSNYGTFKNLNVSPDGNIVANGEMVTGIGTFPLQIRKS